MQGDEWVEDDRDDEWEETCDHSEYDIDVLEGRCRCLCGYSWWASEAQVLAELDAQASYLEEMDRDNRREWWRDLWRRIRSPFSWWPRRKLASDDEIPF